MKKGLAPLALMMIFSLVLALSAVAQQTITAVAKVDETVVFDGAENRYLSSKAGEVDNHYTSARITEKGSLMTFELNINDGTAIVSQYKVVRREKNGKVIIAKKLGTLEQIKIIQKKNSLDVHCDYQRVPDRYNAAIIFTNLNFKPEEGL